MIVFIDNYDSFTFNLVQGFAALDAEVRVFRNDEVSLDVIADLAPTAIVISPGPGTPEKAGISVACVKRFSGQVPLLGVCLGHQCVGAAFGGVVSNAKRIMHGKVSMVQHQALPLYQGLRDPFPAGRYHSLALMNEGLPDELVVDATSEDGEIMGVHHRTHPTHGVQFHPESVLTPSGKRLMRNFLTLATAWNPDDMENA